MPPADPLARRLARLPQLTTRELRDEYARLTGDATASANRPWLVKRVAWRLQQEAHGGLSPAARAKAEEFAGQAQLRLNPPPDGAADGGEADRPAGAGPARDPRLPAPGTVLARRYKGRDVRVEVRRDGFLLDGTLYPSLSAAAAAAATGSHLNGYRFFNLAKETA